MSDGKPARRRGNPNWVPGVSGNPKGSKNAGVTLAKMVRYRIEPSLLVDILLNVALGNGVSFDGETEVMARNGVQVLKGEIKTPSTAERLKAIEMLFDRGWGKAAQVVEIVNEKPKQTLDLAKLSDEELEQFEMLLARVQGGDDDGT